MKKNFPRKTSVILSALCALLSCSSEDAGKDITKQTPTTTTSQLVFDTSMGVASAECRRLSEEELKAIYPSVDFEPGVIKFIGSSPSDRNILLKGLGGTGSEGTTDYAKLTFQVLNRFGVPIPRSLVKFSTSNPNVELQSGGDFTTCDPPATTGSSSGNTSGGLVNVIARAGSIPGTFTVTATTSNGKSVSSPAITMGSGSGSQISFDLTPRIKVLPGCDRTVVGDETDVVAYAGDKNGNYLPDGTQVYFSSNIGLIQPSCVLKDAKCSVKFRVQEPLNGCRGEIVASTTSSEGTLKSSRPVVIGSSIVTKASLYTDGASNPTCVFINNVTSNCSVPATTREFRLVIEGAQGTPMADGTQIVTEIVKASTSSSGGDSSGGNTKFLPDTVSLSNGNPTTHIMTNFSGKSGDLMLVRVIAPSTSLGSSNIPVTTTLGIAIR